MANESSDLNYEIDDMREITTGAPNIKDLASLPRAEPAQRDDVEFEAFAANYEELHPSVQIAHEQD